MNKYYLFLIFIFYGLRYSSYKFCTFPQILGNANACSPPSPQLTSLNYLLFTIMRILNNKLYNRRVLQYYKYTSLSLSCKVFISKWENEIKKILALLAKHNFYNILPERIGRPYRCLNTQSFVSWLHPCSLSSSILTCLVMYWISVVRWILH